MKKSFRIYTDKDIFEQVSKTYINSTILKNPSFSVQPRNFNPRGYINLLFLICVIEKDKKSIIIYKIKAGMAEPRRVLRRAGANEFFEN